MSDTVAVLLGLLAWALIVGPLFLLWWLPGHLEVRELKTTISRTAGADRAAAQRGHTRGPPWAPGGYPMSSRDTALAVLTDAASPIAGRSKQHARRPRAYPLPAVRCRVTGVYLAPGCSARVARLTGGPTVGYRAHGLSASPERRCGRPLLTTVPPSRAIRRERAGREDQAR